MDPKTFLTRLEMMIDDSCRSAGDAETHRPGPAVSLSCSEVVRLAVFGQWAQFPGERGFSRSARLRLRTAFAPLLAREPFDRLPRSSRDVIGALALFLVEQMHAQDGLDEALDSSGISMRGVKWRSTGWLAGQADIGWSKRVG